VTALWTAVAVAALAAVITLLLGDRLRRRRDEAQAYLKGMRSVLSGDPDAAIEALSGAARLGSPEAVETYLALGALFRREGDLARAVRLHRNMLMGPGLPAARRPEVERELAEDYRRSGMLAEAAEIYQRLGPGDPAATAGLRDVRVEQGEYAAAVELQRRLGGGEKGGAVLAHLLAAQARALLPGGLDQAGTLAREALATCPGSADAWLTQAQVSAAAGREAEVLAEVGRALDADPRSATLAWPPVAELRDREAVLRFLEARVAARPDDAALHVLLARTLSRAGRRPEAFAAVRRALDNDRTGEVTFQLREVLRADQTAEPDELEARHDLLVAALLRRGRAPRCSQCGADAPERSWRCRRCGAYDSFP
jgi:lipopolysaccharide assembly protein B